MKTSSPHKIESLESLRGLAAFSVLLSHLVLAFWPSMKMGTGFPVLQLWHRGDFAVRLFFVLSGFVLSISYCKNKNTRLLSAAASRRYFRLYVPAAASVLFAYLLHVCGAFDALRAMPDVVGRSDWFKHFHPGKPSLNVACHEAFLAGLLTEHNCIRYNEVLWTIGVELQGSLLVFATLALFGNAPRRWLVYCTLICGLDLLQLRYFVDFACGMALCDWHCSRPCVRRDSLLWVLVFFAGCCLGDLESKWMEGFGISCLTRGKRWWPTLGAIFLVLSCARSSRLQSLLVARPLVLLGQMSFALYLFHLPIMCSLGAITYMHLSTYALGHDVTALLASLASIIASLAVARTGPLILDPFAISVGRCVEQQLFPTPKTRLSNAS